MRFKSRAEDVKFKGLGFGASGFKVSGLGR